MVIPGEEDFRDWAATHATAEVEDRDRHPCRGLSPGFVVQLDGDSLPGRNLGRVAHSHPLRRGDGGGHLGHDAPDHAAGEELAECAAAGAGRGIAAVPRRPAAPRRGLRRRGPHAGMAARSGPGRPRR